MAVIPALKKSIRPGEEHYFCAWCKRKPERLAIIEDKRGPDGEGPYNASWEPNFGEQSETGYWVRKFEGAFKGMARGKDVRKRLKSRPGTPEHEYAESAVSLYTTRREASRVPMPEGIHVAICRKCQGANQITNSRC